MARESEVYDILIVGAGIGGISTLYHLVHEYSFKGKIGLLEGRSRIGGRIHGITIDDNHVELGANWIHGLINNPLYALTLKYKLVDPLMPGNNLMPSANYHIMGATSTGKLVPINLIEEIYKTYFWFVKKAENVYKSFLNGDDIKADLVGDSVGVFLETEIQNYLKLNCAKDEITERAIFNQALNRETVVSGCESMNDVSLKYFGAYGEFPGGNLTVPDGYCQLLNCLLKDVESKLASEKREECFELLLDHKVTKIKWTGIGKDQDQLVETVCSNGKTIRSKHIVVTLPLGVLKASSSTLFEPSLPQYKIECINSLGFDVVDKIFLEYKTRLSPSYFPSQVNELFCFWTDVDSKSKDWYHKIYSFTKVSDRCLLAWVSGRAAEVAETLNGQEIGKTLTDCLRKFLSNPDFPEPENVYLTKWGSDEFTKGSYCHIPAKSSVQQIELLSQPIYSDPGQDKPQLVFAGEACHPSYFSTTHGAFLSGKKAAFYLLDPENNKEDRSSNATI